MGQFGTFPRLRVGLQPNERADLVIQPVVPMMGNPTFRGYRRFPAKLYAYSGFWRHMQMELARAILRCRLIPRTMMLDTDVDTGW